MTKPGKDGKLINIINEKEKSFFHIFFGNNKNKQKINYLTKKIIKYKAIKRIIDFQVKSFHILFSSCKCIKSINLKKFYRNDIDDMNFMFSNCYITKRIKYIKTEY